MHLESHFGRFSNVTLQFSCLGHFAYCVIPLFLRRSHHLPDQLPGEHTGLPSHTRQYLYPLALQCSIHSHTHLWQIKYGGQACSDGPHVFFYVHQSHGHDSTHPSLCTSWVALWEALVCSYDITHSRAWQAPITSLTATSVSQTVTHPSTNWVQSCLGSVIRLQTVTCCQ